MMMMIRHFFVLFFPFCDGWCGFVARAKRVPCLTETHIRNAMMTGRQKRRGILDNRPTALSQPLARSVLAPGVTVSTGPLPHCPIYCNSSGGVMVAGNTRRMRHSRPHNALSQCARRRHREYRTYSTVPWKNEPCPSALLFVCACGRVINAPFYECAVLVLCLMQN
jgi:hypothetical protein